MNPRQGAVLIGIALGSTWLLGPWLMLVWSGALGAVIGWRVLWTNSRIERTGYLVAWWPFCFCAT